MGVGSAFNTALGGLDAYAQMVGYISDNLANVNTPGFKRVDGSFQSYVTLSTTRFHSPGGVNIMPFYRTLLAGQVNSSDNPTSFAIGNGQGFCPVMVPSGTNGGVANFNNSALHYTRACDFSIDSNGYMVNSAGNFLMGIQEQTTYLGNIPGTPSLGQLVGVRVDPTVYKSIPGAPSTTITYNANFPATAPVNPNVPAGTLPAPASSTVTSQIQIYDSLGSAHTVQLVYTKQPVGSGTVGAGGVPATATSQWQLTSATIPGVAQTAAGVVDPNAAAPGPNLGIPLPASPSLFFDSNGALVGPTGTNAAQPAASVDLFPLAIPWNNATSPSGATSPQNIDMNLGSIATAASAATGSTQYAGSALDVRSVVDATGQGPGSFQNATLDNNGNVVFSYSNGHQLKPFRIPLVTFNDPSKLDRVTGAVFGGNETLAGKPYAQWPGNGDAGTVVPNSVEESNVDIASELTKMIVAQRAYSSNGKVITTSDQMIQEALGFVR